MYALHHCVMHHCGNNAAPADGSSTERYRRDSLAAFLAYWARFALLGWAETPLRCAGRGAWRCCAIAAASAAAAPAAAPSLAAAAGIGVLLLRVRAIAWANCPASPLHRPHRCLRYRRWGLLTASMAAEAAWFGGCAAAWRANPRAALWVLLLPYLLSSLALMFGK